MCLVEDVRPKDPNDASNDESKSFLLVDRKKKTTTPIKGPWQALSPIIDVAAVAPNGSFAVVAAFIPKRSDLNLNGIYVIDPDGAARGPIHVEGDTHDFVDFSGTGQALRLIIRCTKTDRQTKQTALTYVALDPRAMTTTSVERPTGASPNDRYTTSPDGKRSVTSKHGKLVIVDVATGLETSFDVHEDDRKACEHGCVRWANDRYLEYRGNAQGFLDTRTGKLNAVPGLEGAGACTYSADFNWVVENGAEPRVGRIVIR